MPANESMRRLRVLVIEDSDASFATFKVLLGRVAEERGEAFSIDRAADGERGLALLRAGFDVALVDHHIGDVTGVELIRTVRAEGNLSAVIMVTASAGDTAETDAAEAGANDFLSKSEVNVASLARAMRYALRNAGMQAQLAELNANLGRQVEAAVAEQRQAEANLRHIEKMEAVGRATGTIAHDFRNILTVVAGNLDLLKQRLAEGTREMRYVDTALRAIDSGTRLIGDLLAFSHRPRRSPEALLPLALIEEIAPMLRQVCGTSVEVAIEGEEGAGPISVDPAELQRALLNLASNARDAMPNGGKITLDVRHVEVDGGAGSIRISLSDTGEGMSPDVMRQALEPFFTTKDRRSGTGLGLSQVNEFVRAAGGRLDLHSELGAGTTVSLFFPRIAGDQPAAAR